MAEVTEIRYEKLNNLGDYNHEKLSIAVKIESGESAKSAMKKAISFCDLFSAERIREYQRAKYLLNDPNNAAYREEILAQAEAVVAKYEQDDEEMDW